ncbi:MAG: cytochrome c maturation protein CcmE [Pseudomonadota bacterium]
MALEPDQQDLHASPAQPGHQPAPQPGAASVRDKRWQPKHRRMAWLTVGAVMVAAAASLAILALDRNLTFFYSPADFADLTAAGEPLPTNRPIRLGGLVADDSVRRDGDGLTVHFEVTDHGAITPVSFTGILPDLFREGQGVVAIGQLSRDGHFTAQEILAKHDENYMPPEVAAALERNRPSQDGGYGGSGAYGVYGADTVIPGENP